VQALTQVLKTVFGYRSYFLIYQFIHAGNLFLANVKHMQETDRDFSTLALRLLGRCIEVQYNWAKYIYIDDMFRSYISHISNKCSLCRPLVHFSLIN